jgi:hypothetical protein
MLRDQPAGAANAACDTGAIARNVAKFKASGV